MQSTSALKFAVAGRAKHSSSREESKEKPSDAEEDKSLEQEVEKNQAALDKATSIRHNELAEVNAEEKDVLQSMSALKSAVTVLSKHNSSKEESKEKPSDAEEDKNLVQEVAKNLASFSSALNSAGSF